MAASFGLKRLKGIIDAADMLAHAAHPEDAVARMAVSRMAETAASSPDALRHDVAGEPPLVAKSTEEALDDAIIAAYESRLLIASSAKSGEFEPPKAVDLKAVVEDTRQRIAGPGTFGFTSSPAAPLPPSADVESALHLFQEQAEKTLDRMVADAQAVLEGMFAKIDRAEVLSAFGGIGALFEASAGAAPLLRWGIERLRASLQALRSVLDRIPAQLLKQHLGELTTALTVRNGLNLLFGADVIRTEIALLRTPGGKGPAEVDGLTREMNQIGEAYSGICSKARTIAVIVAGIVGIAAAALAWTAGALAVPAAFLVIAAAVVILGMDYADSERVLNRVRGVRNLASALSSQG
jgi:hypothetical protein